MLDFFSGYTDSPTMDVSVDSPFLSQYRPQPGVYDEMLAPDREVRAHWRYLAEALGSLGLAALRDRRHEARRQLRENGVTYTVYGDPQGRARPWELDPIPLLVSSEEWEQIETGLTQRAELLNLVFKDLYGPQELIRRGVLPMDAVYAHGGFLRACHPLNTQLSHPLLVYAVDLVRGPDGRLWVLGDRIQAPSGAGYALENRVVMSRILPSLFRDSHVHRLALFFQNLRASLAALSPRRDVDPRIVVITPGPLNETYFEHSYLASYLGYTLAQGDDLTVQGGRVWLRSMRQLEPVDVILRRVDDDYCDPLELRPDSRLGVPGLVEAVRRGNVAVVNPLGASVLENPALNAFLPAIARHLLGQDLQLPNAASWWCGQRTERDYVLANLDKLVIKPLFREAGVQPVFGALLTGKAREHLVERIRARPHGYVGQEQLSLSAIPTLVEDGLEARHGVLRSFLVAREDGYVVMPGGLTRIAPSQDSLVVSNQAGGRSKDTWILASEPEKQVSLLPSAVPREAAPEMRGALPTGAADNLFWLARYAERAEQGARLLRTVLRVYRNVVEFNDPHDQACLEVLLVALTRVTACYPGFLGPQGAEHRAEPVPELLALIFDGRRSGCLSFNLRALLSAAYAVRDRVSSDTWRVINVIGGKLEAVQNRGRSELNLSQDDLDELISSLAALAGLAQESMLRGQAWLFLDMGRRLERGRLLIALLRAVVVGVREPAQESDLLEAVLTSTESLMAYRRGYHDQPQCEPVLALLMFDEANPRALAFQLKELQARVDALPHENSTSRLPEQARLVLDAVSRLRLADPGALAKPDEVGGRSGLDALLTGIDALLGETAKTLARNYFTDVRGPQQLVLSTQERPA